MREIKGPHKVRRGLRRGEEGSAGKSTLWLKLKETERGTRDEAD